MPVAIRDLLGAFGAVGWALFNESAWDEDETLPAPSAPRRFQAARDAAVRAHFGCKASPPPRSPVSKSESTFLLPKPRERLGEELEAASDDPCNCEGLGINASVDFLDPFNLVFRFGGAKNVPSSPDSEACSPSSVETSLAVSLAAPLVFSSTSESEDFKFSEPASVLLPFEARRNRTLRLLGLKKEPSSDS